MPQAHPQPQSALDLEVPLPPRAHTLLQPDGQREGDQARIAELERMLRRAALQNEVLKKASMLLGAGSIGGGR